MKVALFLELLLVALVAVGRFVWQRRGQALLCAVGFGLGFGGSLIEPLNWWVR